MWLRLTHLGRLRSSAEPSHPRTHLGDRGGGTESRWLSCSVSGSPPVSVGPEGAFPCLWPLTFPQQLWQSSSL